MTDSAAQVGFAVPSNSEYYQCIPYCVTFAPRPIGFKILHWPVSVYLCLF
jgi:hypothetical protein